MVSKCKYGLIIDIEVSILFTFFAAILIFSKDYLNPFIMFFIYSFLGFLDIVFVLFDLRITRFTQSEAIYQQTLLIIILWFFSFSIGYFFISKVRLKRESISSINIIGKIDFNIKGTIVIIFAIMGFVFFKLVSTASSVGGLFAAFSTEGYKIFEGQNYLSMIMAIIGVLPVIYLATNNKKKALFMTLFVLFFMSLTKRRSLALINSLLPILIYYNYKVKRIKIKYLLFMTIPIGIYILYIASMRGIAAGASDTISNGLLSNLVEITRQIQYGENIPDMIAALNSGNIVFQGFNYIFNGILTFIPRGIWKNKPLVESAAIVGQMVYGANVAGHPVGPYGWAYFCFGYYGVVIFGVLNGVIVRRVFEWVKKKNSIFSYLLYSLIIVKLIEIFQPESQFKISFMVLVLVCLSFLSKFFKKFNVKFE
jgi:oligosaccharide repeat unit polymerase